MIDNYRLTELKIEINRECPLSCLHCSSNGSPHAPERLSLDKVSDIIKEFVDIGGQKVCISGGEPLLHRDLPEIIKTCYQVKVPTTIYTCGISRNGNGLKPISDRILELIAEKRVKLIFSLHGASPETHDAMTGVNDSFASTINSIEKAIKIKVESEAHIVPTALNFHEVEPIVRLLTSYRISKVSWLRFVPQGRGYFNQSILKLSKEQIMKLALLLTNLRKKYNDINIRTGAPFNILCSQIPAICEAGISILTIRPDGFIAPCDAFKRFKVIDENSNILQNSLTHVWYNSKFLEAIRKMRESILDSSCSLCRFYKQCNSGCLAQKIIAQPQDGRDPECLFNAVSETSKIISIEQEAITV